MRAYCLKIKDLWTAIQSFRDNRGQIAILTALMAPVLIGGLGIGVESSYWYVQQRGAQNAADAAVVAAATNTSPSYVAEGQAVAAKMGFPNGANNTTVAVTNSATCPGGGTCYQVTVTQVVPLQLAQLIGYHGDATLNGSSAVTISAISYSLQGSGWSFAMGHTLRIQVTQNDAPYLRLDNYPSTISYSSMGLTLPVVASPGC